jgi:hypothetical protein
MGPGPVWGLAPVVRPSSASARQSNRQGSGGRDRPAGFPRDPWPAWPLDPATWRGAIRALPSVTAFMWTLTVMGLVRVATGDETGRRVLHVVGIPLFVVFGLLAAAAWLFNRPQLLTPPAFRSEPGALREWLGR